MAAFDTTRPAAARPAGIVSTFFANVVAAISDWNDARITHKSLSKLSARELDDIGLTYGTIADVTRRTTR